MMNEKAAEARRAYKRAWARNNPEKVRAQQERYWQRQAEKAAAAAAETEGAEQGQEDAAGKEA